MQHKGRNETAYGLGHLVKQGRKGALGPLREPAELSSPPCRCLSLLLEIDDQRAALVHSGALARLLPYLEVALQDRVDALKQARPCDMALFSLLLR
jgi:hypothetical protein